MPLSAKQLTIHLTAQMILLAQYNNNITIFGTTEWGRWSNLWLFHVMEHSAQREVSRVYPSGYPSI